MLCMLVVGDAQSWESCISNYGDTDGFPFMHYHAMHEIANISIYVHFFLDA